MKRTDLYLAVSDVGLFLIAVAVVLNHLFHEKELYAATAMIGASFGIGGLGAWAIGSIIARIFKKENA